MPHRPNRGRVYRRCACRGTRNKQLGAGCPDLRSNPRHGTWTFAVEALALHWADVDLDEQVLFVRYTLSSIRNTTPVMTSPKTKTSHGWVALSARVRRALDRQARQQADAGLPGDSDLVFCRADGQPLRPEYAVRHLHDISDALGLPRTRVHDLRHLAATLMISSQVPIAMASKTLRHSKLSTTVDTYGHLAPYAAQNAVDAIESALGTADAATRQGP